MPPTVRRVALTVHVATSVGWLGAVLAFLVLAVYGLVAGGDRAALGVYLALDPLATLVVLPLGLLALATGVVQAVGTPWGLLGHHWVLAKLTLTAVATGLLILHLGPIGRAADIARTPGAAPTDVGELRRQLIVYAAAALAALGAATALSVFKPAGKTRWARRRRSGRPSPA